MKELDQWIDQLMECKQLAENQVKTLCEKVRPECFDAPQGYLFIYSFRGTWGTPGAASILPWLRGRGRAWGVAGRGAGGAPGVRWAAGFILFVKDVLWRLLPPARSGHYHTGGKGSSRFYMDFPGLFQFPGCTRLLTCTSEA